ncbi:transport system permease protein [Thermovibrio ammonificans HB-1]|uniref:Transport system permease protein n=1 Tax=Thermovibrio ammonificans (strain DSM 15698 / JCM 12110 / HB-1) TaxID=648996 RepID=E8T3V6_THEA1|nr:iron ABC transporter permease [Thermovibrio ammonificans]ADU96166.1 transport system permease protein [Thermovibrio ammonificans HB-1]
MQVVFLVLVNFALAGLFLFYRLPSEAVLVSLRLPQLFVAFSYGGVLAVSGAVFQGALRNPLADGYTLGVASGAALGASLSLLFHLPVELGALVGGLFSVFLLVLGYSLFKDALALLLFGVGLSAMLSAFLLIVYALMPAYTLQDAVLFMLGYMPPFSLKEALLLLGAAVAATLFTFTRWRSVDLLSLGDELAYFSGVNPRSERILLVTASSAALALFVAKCGVVGFLGLIVPHLLRFLGFRVSKELIPLSFLAGGGLFVTSAFGARELLYPTLLPVGVLTTLFGVPVFLFILWRFKGAGG